MRLNLALNGILIASASLDPARCKDEYYLQAMRHLLARQNQDTIELIPANPVYYIEIPASSASYSFGKSI